MLSTTHFLHHTCWDSFGLAVSPFNDVIAYSQGTSVLLHSLPFPATDPDQDLPLPLTVHPVTLSQSTSFFWCVSFTPDLTQCVSACCDGIPLFVSGVNRTKESDIDIDNNNNAINNNNSELGDVYGFENSEVMVVDVSECGGVLIVAVGMASGFVAVWELVSGRRRLCEDAGRGDAVEALVVLPRKGTVLCADAGACVLEFSLDDGVGLVDTVRLPVDDGVMKGISCTALALSPDQRTVAVGSRGTIVLLYSSSSARLNLLKRIDLGKGYDITSISFHPFSSNLFACSSPFELFLVDAKDAANPKVIGSLHPDILRNIKNVVFTLKAVWARTSCAKIIEWDVFGEQRKKAASLLKAMVGDAEVEVEVEVGAAVASRTLRALTTL
jgi:WD40 repeat protein